MKSTSLNDYIEAQLANPDFKKAWHESELQYQTVRQLIKYRLAKKISQRKLARMAKTTQAVVSRVENLSVNPSIRLLERFAHALDMKLEIRFR